MSDEMKTMSAADQMEIFRTMEFKVEIPVLTGLAMKADLGLPWHKLRIIKYIFNEFK